MDKWIVDNLLGSSKKEVITAVINGVTRTFTIYDDSFVQENNGNVICYEGGRECFDEWLSRQPSFSKTIHTITIGDETFILWEYEDGSVTYDGVKICPDSKGLKG